MSEPAVEMAGEEQQAAAEPEAADAAAQQVELPVEPVEPSPEEDAALKAAIEAIVYVTEEPATAAQIAGALGKDEKRIDRLLMDLVAEYSAAAHGVMIREVAGGFKMATKAEHHEAVRAFARSLKPALKLSLAALETLAAIAYKQPVTAPEIMEIRGVQGAGVLKTLLDRKLIQTSGRKNVIGRPILYRTTKDFLLQFGLKDLSELPTLKEFEELRRLAAGDSGEEQPAADGSGAPAPEPTEQAEPVAKGAAAGSAAVEATEPATVAEEGEPATAAEPDPAIAADVPDEAPASCGAEPAAALEEATASAEAPATAGEADTAAPSGEAPAAGGKAGAASEGGTENA